MKVLTKDNLKKFISLIKTDLNTKASVSALNDVSISVDNKVDKVDGKSLTTNDFTDELKIKLDGIADGAEANVQSNWNETDTASDAYIKNKPDIDGKISTVKTALETEISDGDTALDSKITTVNTSLSNKVDKVDGKGLSTNDFTDELKTKLNGIADGAEVNVQANWDETDTASDAYIKNKPDIDGKISTVKTALENEISGAYDYTDRNISSAKSELEGDIGAVSETVDTLSETVNSMSNDIEGLQIDMSGMGMSIDDVKDSLKNKVGYEEETETPTGGELVVRTVDSDYTIETTTTKLSEIALKETISSSATSTNKCLSASEVHELIQKNSAAVICANENLSSGFQLQSSQFHTILTTLTCLEDGPWYKMHDGSIVECGSDNAIYVETNDIATVLEDETLFYFYMHNYKYQRIKLGDPTRPWGAIRVSDGSQVDLNFDATTLGSPCVWICDASAPHEAIHSGNPTILVGFIGEIPGKSQAIREYNDCSTLADVIAKGVKNPDYRYDLEFPSSIYSCVSSQTATTNPVWTLHYSINNSTFTSEQLEVLNSGATEEKITQIATNTEKIATNTASIATNTTDIATNKTNIAANTTAISTINTSLDNKVDKVDGKGLSTNDYTTNEQTKLAGIVHKACKVETNGFTKDSGYLMGSIYIWNTVRDNTSAYGNPDITAKIYAPDVRMDSSTLISASSGVIDISGSLSSIISNNIGTAKGEIFTTMYSALADKQNVLTDAQLTAVNSGITSELVEQISANKEDIAGKQDAFEYVEETDNGLEVTESLIVTGDAVELTTKSVEVNIGDDTASPSKTIKVSEDADSSNITNIDFTSDDTTSINTVNINVPYSGGSRTVSAKCTLNVGGKEAVSITTPAGASGYKPVISLSTYQFGISADSYVDFGTSIVNGGFMSWSTSANPSPNSYWAPTSNVNPSSITFNDSSYYSKTGLSYTFQGCFTASSDNDLPSSTSGGLTINWFGDIGIEAGSFYEFNVRRVGISKCIGIITKLE